MPGPMDCIFSLEDGISCGLTVNLAPLTLKLRWSQRLSCEVGHGKRINEKQPERGCLAGFECKTNMEEFLGKG